jgi:hypothetical protein
MKHTQEYFKISILLYIKQMGLISDEEEILLSDWREESIDNFDICNRLTSDLNIANKRNDYQKIDSHIAWGILQTKIKFRSIKGKKLVLNLLRYAAVLLLPLAIGSLLVYQVVNRNDDYSETIVDQIIPGTSKASLVLSNGDVVNLEEKRDTLIEGLLLNQDNTLTYLPDATDLTKASAKWDKLIVPIGGEYHLQLADGTKVWLNSDSELKYTNQFVGKQRVVYLKGEAFFEVRKDKEHPFIVRTKSMDVKVYGTEFNVMAYEDEELCQTTLLEGSVSVDLKNGDEVIQSSMLKPDMQMEYSRGDLKGSVQYVDASLYLGWKDGLFQFNNENLGSILRKISRWYNVKFFTQNQSIQNIRFSGEMKRFEDFATILNLLELGSNVRFKVQGDVVIVRCEN